MHHFAADTATLLHTFFFDCVSIVVGLQEENVSSAEKKVKKHSADITLMAYSWSALFHYVAAILIFSSSTHKTVAVQ